LQRGVNLFCHIGLLPVIAWLYKSSVILIVERPSRSLAILG